MPKLYVLVGVPGSGKSTWARNQPWAKDCAYVSTDDHVEDEADRLGRTYSDVFKSYMPTAVSLMTEDVINAKKDSRDIIWDQTSTTRKSRAKKFHMLPDYYKIAVVFKTPEAAELNRRLGNRKGKHIPQQVMQQMIGQFEMPTKEEGFDEVWHAA
jgi:predicted kinase